LIRNTNQAKQTVNTQV